MTEKNERKKLQSHQRDCGIKFLLVDATLSDLKKLIFE